MCVLGCLTYFIWDLTNWKYGYLENKNSRFFRYWYYVTKRYTCAAAINQLLATTGVARHSSSAARTTSTWCQPEAENIFSNIACSSSSHTSSTTWRTGWRTRSCRPAGAGTASCGCRCSSSLAPFRRTRRPTLSPWWHLLPQPPAADRLHYTVTILHTLRVITT